MNAELSKNRLWIVRLLRMHAMKEANDAEVPGVIFYCQPMERQRRYPELAAQFSSDRRSPRGRRLRRPGGHGTVALPPPRLPAGPSGLELLPKKRKKPRGSKLAQTDLELWFLFESYKGDPLAPHRKGKTIMALIVGEKNRDIGGFKKFADLDAKPRQIFNRLSRGHTLAQEQAAERGKK
jgi:hypothetical protein